MIRFPELNSLQNRIAGGFIFLCLLFALLGGLSLHIFHQVDNRSKLFRSLNQLDILTLNLIKTDNEYFDLELIREEYFKTGESLYIKKRDSINGHIRTVLEKSIAQEQPEKFVLLKLKSIDSLLIIYNLRFKKLESLVLKKGFKDYGVEGRMREHAHLLEKESADHISEILFLRRHEKDFLLRGDELYINLFVERKIKLDEALRKINSAHQSLLLHHLAEYTRLFLELASIEQQIGLNSQQGIRNELNILSSKIGNTCLALSDYALQEDERSGRWMKVQFLIIFILGLIFVFFAALWLSKKISEPITRLSRVMANATNLSKTLKTDFSVTNAAQEVVLLSDSFNSLMNRTQNSLEQIQSKSKLLRQKNKELKKLNKELDHFLYSTAHDLRSPLSSLLGLMNLARMENQQKNLDHYFQMMNASVIRLETFIEQIVNYSKNKRIDLALEEVDMEKLIYEALDHHRFMPGFDHINIILDIRAQSIPFYSDRARLMIILNNLISNAGKYYDPGKVNPFLKITSIINQNQLILECEDNGIGIEKKHLNKIFNMFYRASHQSKGSGLGLFIFKETIVKLGGKFQVDSELGVGTSFIIHIPNQLNEVTIQINSELAQT